MMRKWLLILGIAGGAAAGPCLAELPARVEIAYELSHNGSPIAEVIDRLEHAAGAYQLTETWEGRGVFALLGKARRFSQGRFTAEGLRPEEFFDERTGRDTARAWFDWNAMTLTMQHTGARRSEPLPANAQDRLSFFLALSFLPGKGESIKYTVIDGKGLSRHEYRVLGRERVTTPAGDFEAVKVERWSAGKDTAHLWLALERWNLPVRLLLIDKDGVRLDQVATRITAR